MSVAHLDQYGFLTLAGRDAVKFLQGYTTCDLEQLQPGKAALGAVCNIQGRMLNNFLVADVEGALVLRMHRDLIAVTKDFLAKYIVFSKATMTDSSDEFVSLGLTDEPALADAVASYTYPDSRIEAWVKKDEAPAQTDADTTLWCTADLLAGFAWVSPATSEQYIPQMFQLESLQGIDFKKGCYLGQEIVARMQYRGELKKRLHIATLSSTVATGTPVNDNAGKNLGEVVASAGKCCLAVLRNTDPTIEATIEGNAAEFVSLPRG